MAGIVCIRLSAVIRNEGKSASRKARAFFLSELLFFIFSDSVAVRELHSSTDSTRMEQTSDVS